MKKIKKTCGALAAVILLSACGGSNPDTAVPIDSENPSVSEGQTETSSGEEMVLPENPGSVPESEWPQGQEDDQGDEPTTPGKDLVATGGFAVSPGAAGVGASLMGTDSVHQTHLQMIRVRWKVGQAQGLKSAYLHATFNRLPADADESDPCGEIGGRYLAVNDDGNDFNAGSADAQAAAPYLTGEQCHNNLDCRHMAGDLVPDSVASLKSAGPSDKPQRIPGPKTPVCRIDLMGPFVSKGVLEGEFFTFSHQKEFRMVLVTESEAGVVVHDERVWTAPKPVVDSVQFSEASGGRVRVSASYRYARRGPMLWGCSGQEEISSHHQPDGSGEYTATCAVAPSKISLAFPGVGSGNHRKKTYRIETEGASLQLNDTVVDRWCETSLMPFDHCAGLFSLRASVKAGSYRIRDSRGDVVAEGESKVGGSVRLYQRRLDRSGEGVYETVWEPVADRTISPFDDAVFNNVRRDHFHTAWKAVVTDVSGETVATGESSLPYELEFEHELVNPGLPLDCDEDKALLRAVVSWKIRHALEIVVTTPLQDSDPVSSHVYDPQSGSLYGAHGHRDLEGWVIDTEGRKTSFQYEALCLE